MRKSCWQSRAAPCRHIHLWHQIISSRQRSSDPTRHCSSSRSRCALVCDRCLSVRPSVHLRLRRCLCVPWSPETDQNQKSSEVPLSRQQSEASTGAYLCLINDIDLCLHPCLPPLPSSVACTCHGRAQAKRPRHASRSLLHARHWQLSLTNREDIMVGFLEAAEDMVGA